MIKSFKYLGFQFIEMQKYELNHRHAKDYFQN